MWNRVKQCFKKKPRRDTNIEQNKKGEFVLKEVCPYELDPQVPDGMKIHTKYLGRRCNGNFAFEVNGVVMEGKDILDVQRKYLRQKKGES